MFYRSQRCSKCGLVLKKNRKGKRYNCSCGLDIDADLNAAINHESNLPDSAFVRHLNLNNNGFYWRKNGFYDLDGKELKVPSTKKE